MFKAEVLTNTVEDLANDKEEKTSTSAPSTSSIDTYKAPQVSYHKIASSNHALLPHKYSQAGPSNNINPCLHHSPYNTSTCVWGKGNWDTQSKTQWKKIERI